jgi:NhaP-type Na+/H+ or K+/H+ antiporter
VLGIGLEAVAGYLLFRVFEKYNLRATRMTIIIMAVSIVLTWLEKELKTKVAMSALLGVMTIGFIILETCGIRAHKISQKLAKVRIFAEILLFVLLGAQVNIQVAWHAGFAGAVPLEAGVRSGDIILAVAVLSILLIAPIGAIGIQFAGDRWLEREPRDVRKKGRLQI